VPLPPPKKKKKMMMMGADDGGGGKDDDLLLKLRLDFEPTRSIVDEAKNLNLPDVVLERIVQEVKQEQHNLLTVSLNIVEQQQSVVQETQKAERIRKLLCSLIWSFLPLEDTALVKKLDRLLTFSNGVFETFGVLSLEARMRARVS